MTKSIDTATILEGRDNKKLSKTFTAQEDGTIKKTNYQNAFLFEGEEVPLNGIDDLYKLQKQLIDEPFKMIVRGELIGKAGSLIHRRKKGKHASLKDKSHNWFMLDIDKLELPSEIDPVEDPEEAVKYAISTLPKTFGNVTCVWCFSASQSVPKHVKEEVPNTASLHLFFWCDRKLSNQELKKYFKSLPICTVDLALFNSVQAHYMSKPEFINMSDPLKKRFDILRGKVDFVTIHKISLSKTKSKTQEMENKEPLNLSAIDKEKLIEILVQHHPSEGGRGDYYASVAGVFYRKGMDRDTVADIIFTAAEKANDDEALDRKEGVLRICDAVDNGESAQGIPALKQYIKDSEKLNALLKLLGVTKSSDQEKLKPTIYVLGGGLSRQATRGEQALIDAGLPIYQRGAQLVKPIIQKTESSKNRQTKIAVLHPLSTTRLRDHLCDVAQWEIPDGEKLSLIDPPKKVADTILNRFGAWRVPSLAGVIMTPTLRSDGTVIIDKGYDKQTRLFLLDSPEMPSIPDAPTKDDALAALKLLDGLLVDFPFINEASRSVALSALITPIIRGACDVVPMHVISAPTPGTGKSYLLDTASAIAIGQPCPIIAAGKTEEETEKRLGAALLTGQSILSIDNLNGDLAGDALCQAIERPFFTMRILGKSENVTIESRSTLYANGNNIRLRGDITRRAVQCIMDAGIERPELREFKIDPVQMVLNDRGKYVAAILTIARAYIVAGKPDVIKPRLASFEDWSDLVRSCLVWLGCTDTLATMEDARSEDPELQAMSNVFTALWDVTRGQKYTAKQIVGLATSKDGSTWEHDEQQAEVLKEALINVAGDNKGFITPLRLGKWLSRKKGRICNNFKLENEVDKHGHAAKWCVINLDDRGSAGESGSIPTEQNLIEDEDDLPM